MPTRKKNLTITIREDILERVDELSEKVGSTKSKVVELLLMHCLGMPTLEQSIMSDVQGKEPNRTPINITLGPKTFQIEDTPTESTEVSYDQGGYIEDPEAVVDDEGKSLDELGITVNDGFKFKGVPKDKKQSVKFQYNRRFL